VSYEENPKLFNDHENKFKIIAHLNLTCSLICNQVFIKFFQILTFLRFVGTNSFYHGIRDVNGPSIQTVGRVIQRVGNAIFEMRNQFIKWPQNPETLARDFYEIAGIPSVVGAIDGCHILVSPPKEDEISFVNRHHTHSINVLCIAGPQRQIHYVNVNHGGRSHDSRVLQNSSVWQKFEVEGQLPFPGAVLLGDSGYPLRQWLITPFSAPADQAQQRFNFAHSKTRCIVEQTFGLLKNRFSCLKSGLRVKDMTLAGRLIIACIVLHNLCILHGADEVEGEDGADEENQPAGDMVQVENDARGNHRRLQLLAQLQQHQRNI
jgi:nuclease HARBI1